MPAIRVLTAQYYHFKAIIIAGMGLFTDSYDLFCIAHVMKLIGRVYFAAGEDGQPGVTPPAVVSATVGVALLGAVLRGQRLLRVGIGGDYPLSATIMFEFANKRTRGAFIAAVFSMQGFGILASSGVTMAVAAAFDRFTGHLTPQDTPECTDLAWRIILMIGAVPASLTFYRRMAMPETPRGCVTDRVPNPIEAAPSSELIAPLQCNRGFNHLA
ncbi:hypothetical protein EJB05_44994, partial [Eragrostis curvula]